MKTSAEIREDAEAARSLPYRPCVGIMLFSAYGLVWIGRRLPKWADDRSAYVWQMPQGGIEGTETPQEAAIRELREETGVRNAEILDEIDEWLSYDLPDDLLGVAMKGKYRGQRQRWFAMRMTGPDSDVDIKVREKKAEFDAWRWARIEEVVDVAVPFKREVYRKVARAFAPLAG
jgi:putative (di)nucleoside polyphosphate hydrolase